MQLNLYTYSFPFKEPFSSSSQTLKNRKGLIFELKDNGIISLGEAAPLPGFSPETLEQVVQQSQTLLGDIKVIFSDEAPLEALQVFYRKNNLYPSLQFALDTLCLDLLAQRAGVARQHYLFDNTPDRVPVNGVVTLKEEAETLASVQELVNGGFKTVKIKVGADFNRELETLRLIRSEHPNLKLRLDANGAWNLEDAVIHLEKLSQLDVEYCEEPLSNPNPKNLKQLHAKVTVPVAVDESFLTFQDPEKVMPYVSTIILKPMVFGSLTKLFATNRLTKHHNNKVIYTTSLESGIGRTMTAILAAGLGDSNSAHGLATGSLLKMDVWHDGTYINNGSFLLPDRVELGKRYQANYKHLEKIQ